MVLLDIAKAYDSVEQWAMKQTLEAYGMHPTDVSIIMNLLEDNKTTLLTAFGPTDTIPIKSGVRQGDTISPILFSLFLNPLLTWLEKGRDPYRTGNEQFYAQAFADDTALLASSKKGIEDRMNRVNLFMQHNNISINEDKSTYHWNRDSAGNIETRGRKLKYEGDTGLFTYLGWTTNLHLDWTEQVNILIKRFQQLTYLIMSEKKFQINQRVTLINTMALPTITYRTKLMYKDHLIWLSEMDKWLLWVLNKRANVSPQTHEAYWHKFRGLKNTFIENRATYIAHSIDRVLNDERTDMAVKCYTMRAMTVAIADYGAEIECCREDKIEELGLSAGINKALSKADIRFIPQLIRDGKHMNTRQIDQLNMDAPGPGKYWNNWTQKVAQATKDYLTRLPPKMEEEREWTTPKCTVYTDGSIRNKQGTWGVYYSRNFRAEAGSTSGKQEINNTELQAIEQALRTCRNTVKLTIVSDSLNAIRYCTKNAGLPNRKIRGTENAPTKLAIKELLQERWTDEGSIHFLHIRSHSDETEREDHEKRLAENQSRFGSKTTKRVAGNKWADKLAEEWEWDHVHRPAYQCVDKFSLKIAGETLHGRLIKAIKTRDYQLRNQEWHRKQKSYSAFDTDLAHKLSLPNKNDGFANLTCKIMTGTIWTNTLKKRLKMDVEDENCTECKKVGVTAPEDHRHVLGLCRTTRTAYDIAWEGIQRIWSLHGIRGAGVCPWFHTTREDAEVWGLSLELGSKGLVPRELFTTIHKNQPDVDKDTIKAITGLTIKYWKFCVRAVYSNRNGAKIDLLQRLRVFMPSLKRASASRRKC